LVCCQWGEKMKLMEDLEFKPCLFGGVHAPVQNFSLASEIDSGRIQHGVWECGPGELDLKFEFHETVFIIDGFAEIENQVTRERFTLSKGSMMSFERGSHWLWRIPWKLSKVFTIIA
jgi:uncharacterized cupin superfamily protein